MPVASSLSSLPNQMERRKALLIESRPNSNTELAELFDEGVWDLSYASNNATALLLAQANVFDLILTNAETSCAEDVEMLRRLRSVRPHTRVIILTREWMPGDILKAIRNHAFSYFRMPIAKEDLKELIEIAANEPAWDDGIEWIQGTSEHVVIAVRCDLESLNRLTQFMSETEVMPPVETEEVAFAFREIVMNAMEHGGKFDPNKFVEVCYLKSKRMVMCRVKDPGAGFSMDEIKVAEITGPLRDYAEQTRDGKDADLPPGGLGILMAKKFVDDLIFSEKGNEAFLIKYLPPDSDSRARGR
jgi:anti-sigma regulatory factor (Ser/Thr protein kinase)/ActR/RegA family two-component response regulator